MALIFAEKVKYNSTAFLNRVKDIASTLGFPADWLMLCINFETGGTFSPSVKNPSSSATGLIQFMEATARDLGTTTAQLAAMTNVQQLDYVYKYLAKVQKTYGAFNHPVDLYLAIFYPAAIPKPLDYRFPNNVYAVNKVFDVNKRGYFTKADVQEKLLSTAPAGYAATFKKKIQ